MTNRPVKFLSGTNKRNHQPAQATGKLTKGLTPVGKDFPILLRRRWWWYLKSRAETLQKNAEQSTGSLTDTRSRNLRKS